MNKAIVLIAYGESARNNALEAVQSIRKFHDDIDVIVYVDKLIEIEDCEVVLDVPRTDNEVESLTTLSRLKKINLDRDVKTKTVLYMDVDCRVRADLSAYFEAIDDGFDFVITPSTVQGDRWAQHTTQLDRDNTIDLIGYTPLQMQCGVFAYRRTMRVISFFAQWRKEYGLYSDKDQLAFTRALYLKPMKVHILSPVFNNGAVIQHLFGNLKR